MIDEYSIEDLLKEFPESLVIEFLGKSQIHATKNNKTISNIATFTRKCLINAGHKPGNHETITELDETNLKDMQRKLDSLRKAHDLPPWNNGKGQTVICAKCQEKLIECKCG
jgi:hypothetical protein